MQDDRSAKASEVTVSYLVQGSERLGTLRGCSQHVKAASRTVPELRRRSVPSTYLPIYFSPMISLVMAV